MLNTKKTCYLFLDFDGTVYLNGKIPEENRKALAAAQRMGHQLILNTGRSRGGLDLSLERHHGVSWDGMIFGASDITFRGNRYHEHTLSAETVEKWIRYGMEHRYWMHIEGENRNQYFSFDKHADEFTKEETDEVFQVVKEAMRNNPVTKLTLQRAEPEDVVGTGLKLISQDTYSELFPDGRDKGVGFLDFCRLYDVPKEQCICFGDSLNDLAIFEVCPTGVSMRHAPEALKKLSAYCAESEFGVAEGIAWLFG